MPLLDPTVATIVLLLLHVPPETASLSVSEVPWQKVAVPPIAAGDGYTVTMAVVRQPVGSVYVIVAVEVVVTVAAPVTTPVLEPTVATLVLLLLHVPPPASLKFVVNPAQTDRVPVIVLGNESTLTI
jgi:hypothetical protein